MKKILPIITFLILLCLAGVHPVSAAELTNQFSISTWIKADTAVATRAIAVKNNEVRLVTDASGFPLCQIHNGTAWQTAATSATAIAVNTWAQVTCTYDKVTLRIFVNGVQTGTQALTVSLQDTANVLKFGQDDSGTYTDLAGTLDDMRVFNYALTGRQITNVMNGSDVNGPGVGSPVGHPVAHYSFDEGFGVTTQDQSINNNDGTLTGMASPATSTSGLSNSGKYGKALAFDGTDDYVNIGASNYLDGASQFTVSEWVNFGSSFGEYEPLFTQRFDSMNNRILIGNGNSNGNLEVVISNGTNDYDIINNVFSVNTWYHVVVVFDG